MRAPACTRARMSETNEAKTHQANRSKPFVASPAQGPYPPRFRRAVESACGPRTVRVANFRTAPSENALLDPPQRPVLQSRLSRRCRTHGVSDLSLEPFGP